MCCQLEFFGVIVDQDSFAEGRWGFEGGEVRGRRSDWVQGGLADAGTVMGDETQENATFFFPQG